MSEELFVFVMIVVKFLDNHRFMLFLLRNIRRKLLSSDNKVISYLLYAIGEIILVVAGILIAVAIDDWNERKKNYANYVEVLKEVQKDIFLTVNSVPLEYFARKDSMIEMILATDPDATVYRRFGELSSVLMLHFPILVEQGGFQKLKKLGEVPEEYKEIISQLNVLYGTWTDTMLKVDEKNDDLITFHRQNIRETYPWASTIESVHFVDSLDERYIDYLVNDPIYRNRLVAYHMDLLRWELWNLRIWLNTAVKDYYAINKLVGANEVSDNYMRKISPPAEDIDLKYEGVYVAELVSDTLTFKIVSDSILLKATEEMAKAYYEGDSILHLVALSTNRFRYGSVIEIEFDSLAEEMVLTNYIPKYSPSGKKQLIYKRVEESGRGSGIK